ncbi:hypothetical protein REPUB_Repub20aG0122800 [Reevesia pubescens]
MENKFKMSFTLPVRMATPLSLTSVDNHQYQSVEYRNSEVGMCNDVMETFSIKPYSACVGWPSLYFFSFNKTNTFSIKHYYLLLNLVLIDNFY